MAAKRIVIGISGATGFAYGIKALELLKPIDDALSIPHLLLE